MRAIFDKRISFNSQATRTFSLFSPTFCRLLFIHSLLNAIAEVRTYFIRHDAWTVRTSSGQSGDRAYWRCTELQVSQNSSRPAGRRGSPDRQGSTTRDTLRSTAGGPTPRDSDRGRPSWVRLVDPRKVSDWFVFGSP